MSSLLPALLLVALAAGCSSTRNTTPPPDAPQAALPKVDSTVLAVFDGQTLKIDEFEQRYARTVGSVEAAADDSLPALRDFLQRYLVLHLFLRCWCKNQIRNLPVW